MGSVAIRQIVIGRAACALLIALGAGLISVFSPAAAVLVLGVLLSAALTRSDVARIDWPSFAGPAFACVLVGAFVGLAGAIGIAFVWRLFSDARWSVHEARRLALAAGRPGETNFAALAHAWLTPLYGLAIVAYTAPHMVAGLPLDLPHVPSFVPVIIGFAATAMVFDWALRRAADWRLGDLASAPAAHLACHHTLFVVAFGIGLDVSAGLIGLIAWRLAHAIAQPRAQASLTAVP